MVLPAKIQSCPAICQSEASSIELHDRFNCLDNGLWKVCGKYYGNSSEGRSYIDAAWELLVSFTTANPQFRSRLPSKPVPLDYNETGRKVVNFVQKHGFSM